MRRRGVGQVCVVEEEPGRSLVRIAVEVVDPARVERARATDEAVDLVALLEEELGQVGAVLSGDAGDQRTGGHGRRIILPSARFALPRRARIVRRVPCRQWWSIQV